MQTPMLDDRCPMLNTISDLDFDLIASSVACAHRREMFDLKSRMKFITLSPQTRCTLGHFALVDSEADGKDAGRRQPCRKDPMHIGICALQDCRILRVPHDP